MLSNGLIKNRKSQINSQYNDQKKKEKQWPTKH